MKWRAANLLEDTNTSNISAGMTKQEFDNLLISEKLVLVDFHADWCAPCKRMEKVTFSDQRVKAKLAQFAALQADVTRNTLDDKLLLKQYKLVGPPGIVFFDRAGQEIPAPRVIGFEPAEKFLKTLDQALAAR